jgi:hypothetical protein
MKAERRVSLVIGYEPAFGKPPADVAAAGLTATLAAVLSTFRSDSADSVRDHALWLACARAITEAVAADNVEVYGEAPNGIVSRLLRKRVGNPLGTLAAYAAQLSSHVDPPDWAFIRWKRDGTLVAAAMSEPWDQVGGPDLYHDSYTTCVFVPPPVSPELVEHIRQNVVREGGHVESVVDLGSRGSV